MTTAEVAEALGVTRRRARQLAEFLHAEKGADGRLLFDRRSVETLAESRHERAAATTGVAANRERIAALEKRLAAVEARLAALEGR